MEQIKPTTSKNLLAGVVVVNLIVLVVYTLLLRINYGRQYEREYGFLIDAFLIAAQVVICLVMAIFNRPKEFLLSAGLVLVIGFSTCVIGV